MVGRLSGRLARYVPAPLRRGLTRAPFMRRLRNRMYRGPGRPGPAAGELRAVVYLPTWASWDRMRQRPHYILDEFARRGHPVYFVDPQAPGPSREGPVRIVTSLAGVPASGVLVYAHYAPVHAQVRLFDDVVVLYDITDDLSVYAAREGVAVSEENRRAHEALLAAADVVSAASDRLAERYRPERPDLVAAPTGVDLELFATPARRPSDLPDDDRPLAGYHGAVADWRFDWDLFAAVAAALPGWWFPVIGPVDERDAARAAPLGELPNVLLLGERRAAELPGYVQAFDVGTMYYPRNLVTEAALPMKLYEYLAAGIPAVSTTLAETTGVPGIRTADDPAAFAAAIEAAHADARRPGFAAEAAAAAAGATWARRLEPVFAAFGDRLRVGG